MLTKITHTYMLIGSGWAYPGRHLHPSKRWLEHLAGECKTTAPRIATDETTPIMVPMEEYDFDLNDAPEPNGGARLLEEMLAGKLVPDGYEILCAVYPHYSKEAAARGRETMRRNGTGIFDPRTPASSVETHRKNGTGLFDPRVRSVGQARSLAKNSRDGTGIFDAAIRESGRTKGHVTMRKKRTGLFDPNIRARGLAAQRQNGAGFFDPEVNARAVAKSMKVGRRNGWPNMEKARETANHIRWHVNRSVTNSECGHCAVGAGAGAD